MRALWEGVLDTDTLAQMFSSLLRCVSRLYRSESLKLHRAAGGAGLHDQVRQRRVQEVPPRCHLLLHLWSSYILNAYDETVTLFIMSSEVLKGKVHLKIKNICLLLPVVLFIHFGCFGVSCWVLAISAIEMSAFFKIWWSQMPQKQYNTVMTWVWLKK